MRALALLTAAVLAGCAALPPPPPAGGWSGKLGYRIEAGGERRPQAGSALFELQGDAARGQLLLTSPLGTALAQAQWDAQGLRLHDGRQWTAFPSLDALGQALGETLQGPPLPLQALFDWLAGRPWPGAPSEALPAGAFLQLGWRVERVDERLLNLERPAQGAVGATRLRLVLNP